VIFLLVPTELRLARLAEREHRRCGPEALTPGGALHAHYVAFLTWAAAYDAGGDDMRSRGWHERWLAALPCPYMRLDGTRPVADQIAPVEDRLTGHELRGS